MSILDILGEVIAYMIYVRMSSVQFCKMRFILLTCSILDTVDKPNVIIGPIFTENNILM